MYMEGEGEGEGEGEVEGEGEGGGNRRVEPKYPIGLSVESRTHNSNLNDMRGVLSGIIYMQCITFFCGPTCRETSVIFL